ncbi:phospholipase D-like domain-containing protein [Shewanella sp. AS16]|uniref:phospholipase D-like domain-containing protein n=1 Tax=Shewanella sp. AS16 TaxID=2907625 RepID=UPI001F2DBE9E|nr:phospholipase D-like domain-containing protein [Shewanella sp. AS16]MCE9685889.1 phospholipase D-like domain-containing protein [Shewanella sp. AS16]
MKFNKIKMGLFFGFRLSLAAGSFCVAGLSHADDIEVYFNHSVNPPAVQADLEQKIVELINSADNSLYMAIYDLDLPGIANAMVAAKQRGVDVKFVTDEDNIAGENTTALGILDQGGVPWIDDTENGSAGSKIQHNKFIVVDGKKVLSGSTNFSQSGVHGDLDANGNLINEGNDNHIVIIDSNQLASVYTHQFNLMWGDGPGGAKDSLFGLGKPDHQLETVYTNHDNIRIDVQFTPQSSSVYQGSTLYNMQQYIRSAKTRIHLAQFVISAQDVADEMELRHDAGVEVQGIGDPGFFSRYYSEFQDMLGKETPDASGAMEVDGYTGAVNNVWENPADVRIAKLEAGDKWHHKYIIIDDMVLTGSHNISGAAAFGNDENIIIIHDKQTADEFEGHFSHAFCLAGNGTDCTQPSYGEGTWEGVFFTGAEVAVVLDMVNNASLTELDIDAGMNKTAVNNIIAARPIDSMDTLVAVPYVGAAAMQDLKDYINTWQSK